MVTSTDVRVSLHINGIVQGVGFRPTVYKKAIERRLNGFVNNSAQGVFIEIQGEDQVVNNFVNDLKSNPPPLAKINYFKSVPVPIVSNESSFKIIESESNGDKTALITPDVALCKKCISDILIKETRRYHYPFTNCTDCGPRYSIIKDRPYDRPKTSMDKFKMCPSCLTEYNNPMDRRFHAQPNGCSICGPQLYVLNNPDVADVVKFAVKEIGKGKILALKGLGGFNIVCDPSNRETVERLRTIKNRPNKSFAMMARNLLAIDKQCYLDVDEAVCLGSAPSPIVLLKKRDCSFNHLSPDNNSLGIMLPYTPLHYLIMDHFEFLVMTSANRANEPIAINDEQVQLLIKKGIVDYAICYDRDIVNRSDDSIVQFINGKRQVIRRSRGFVPTPFYVDNIESQTDSLVALGSNYKNTFALKSGKAIFVSPHIGDLVDIRNFDFQKESISSYSNLLDIIPKKQVGDAHPGYENSDVVDYKIFHHHAHMLSCMAEHNLLGQDILGVICDGVGYGRDGNIWGFEFLIVNKNYRTFSRVGSLDYFALPGGDKSQYEIDRIGISLLKESLVEPEDYYGTNRVKLINCVLKNLNLSPLTSSLGRLFDGVASLLNLVQKAEYEARGAIMLESLAEGYNRRISLRNSYRVVFLSDDRFKIDYRTLIKDIISDLQNGISHSEIAYKFHYWVVESIIKGINFTEYKKVVFSGGCFQNRLLVELLMKKLDHTDINYYFNWEVPTNDAGISVGQAVI